MPKIAASTVVEHRAQQRASLLAAAEDLLVADGYAALNFGTLAERTGLARPSMYKYFASKDDLVAAVCEEALPPLLARLTTAMDRANSPRDKLVAYVRTQLEMVAEGGHELAATLARASLPPAVRKRIRAVHDQFAPNIEQLLADLGDPRPTLTAAFVQGVINEATRQIHNEPAAETITAAVGFILSGTSARWSRSNALGT
ncbi:TetR/AcrR family transcriptional regulator [Amycolatopsis alkalitolerans]|uniref:TetR/AcrR family transcriptional regulator n=1 Tax=Amycolatopsis alkalitolerans TaxID=2547244 RepID=UPI0013594E21|nr:TetR/AcrR family transcriptional regulator [Amycolatopsis alkalitolerans]